MKNLIVYTANVGLYDQNRDDILCFTDYDRFVSPRLNAKIYKVLYYQFIKSEWSIWIDSNVKLKVSPDYLIDLTDNKEICVFKHPRRSCLYKEAEICKYKKLDYDPIIDAQVLKYKNLNYPINNGLAECRIIIRKNTKNMRDLCNNWWSEICAGSWRDQISFPFVFQNADVKYLDPNIRDSIYYKEEHKKSRRTDGLDEDTTEG